MREWLREHSRELASLGSLVALVTVFVGAVTIVFRSPELEIRMEQTPLAMPGPLQAQFDQVISDSAVLASTPQELGAVVVRLDDFLKETESFTAVHFRNNTNAALENLRIRMTGLHRLVGWGVRGDGLTPDEAQAVLRSVVHSDETGVFTGQMDELPPMTTLSIYLWGDLPTLTFSDVQPITASFDGGGGEMVRTVEVKGVNAFIYSNAGFLLLFAIAVNVAILAWACSETTTESESD